VISGFKDFILRGNVMDLAVAVVIGTAFAGLVNAVVVNLFNPLIGAIFNAATLKDALPLNVGVATIGVGGILAAIIQFLITATVIYFAFVMPLNHLKKLTERKKEAGTEEATELPPTEAELLVQIRDLLATQAKSQP
jgi:large conductance mechanosensitive channel